MQSAPLSSATPRPLWQQRWRIIGPRETLCRFDYGVPMKFDALPLVGLHGTDAQDDTLDLSAQEVDRAIPDHMNG